MAFDADIKVFVDALGPEAAQMLAEAGRLEKETVEIEQSNRRGVMPLTHIAVDGQPVNDFSSVKAESIIFEYWDYRVEIVKAAFEECKARAPVLTGRYRDGFFALLDGEAMEPGELPSAQRLQNIERISVSNKAPYSRRLEVGKTETGDSFAKTVDPHIIESSAKVLREEFGQLVRITFGFVELEGAYKIGGGWRATRARKLGAKKHSTEKALRYPAIFIDQA